MRVSSLTAVFRRYLRVRALASAAQDFLPRPPYADMEMLWLTGNMINPACTLLQAPAQWQRMSLVVQNSITMHIFAYLLMVREWWWSAS